MASKAKHVAAFRPGISGAQFGRCLLHVKSARDNCPIVIGGMFGKVEFSAMFAQICTIWNAALSRRFCFLEEAITKIENAADKTKNQSGVKAPHSKTRIEATYATGS